MGCLQLTAVESPEYIRKILEQGILNIICDCLKLDEAKYLVLYLEAFGYLLAFEKDINTKGSNPIVNEVDKIGMLDILEKLQYHPVELVYQKTFEILETYFETKTVE